MFANPILALSAAVLLAAAVASAFIVLRMLGRMQRRSREYDVLTQVAQALSARHSRDEILGTLHRGLGQLFDTSNFFIAFAENGVMSFELEVHAGVVMPKRTRPMMANMTEHVLRTGQPLLVVRDADAFRKENGLASSNNPVQSFCGAPVTIHGATRGVMAAVSYDHENAFSEHDLEMLRFAAGFVGVAIENSEAFAQQQQRAKYLDFLNNVSRAALSSKTAEQMLEQVVSHIHGTFGFSHTAISMLDYSTKELVVKAEAGDASMMRGIDSRSPFDGDLLHTIQASANGKQAQAALWHPITYGETMLGVLQVEPGPKREFSNDEVLILGTLGDLLATALHNLVNYRKLEYESITDSLTNLKTRRFFLESIQSEFKRASRSGRPFAIVMIDLDKFKQVNDSRGHLEGDLVLARVGRILEQKIRQSNVVARYGGDEFIVLMPETNIDQACILGERLRGWLAGDSMLCDRGITGSFGLASFPLHGASIEEVMRSADEAMYLSKSAGGNHVSQASPLEVSDDLRKLRVKISEHLDKFLHPAEMFERNGNSHSPEQLVWDLRLALERLAASLSTLERRRGVMEGLRLVAAALETTEDHASGHGEYVARHCDGVARELHLSPEELADLHFAALVHDIGKLAVPRSVLNKMGTLTPEEYEMAKRHAQAGADLISVVPNSERIQAYVRAHHESFDGQGYPLGLKGDQIPLGARILGIAESYSWLTSTHSFAAPRTLDAAIALIEQGRGTRFDPALVELFAKQIRGDLKMAVQA